MRSEGLLSIIAYSQLFIKKIKKYSDLLFQFPLILFSAALQGVTITVPYFRLTATQLSVFAVKG